jgi:phosphomevalonate kinase
MRVRAPGKLLLTGAYAVLEGAPAVVVAVDRHAYADDAPAVPSGRAPMREVVEAFEGAPPPDVDVSGLHAEGGGGKLGLGSSAAALVAALGIKARRQGADLADASVRGVLFVAARAIHARVQAGGSGVDVAASTFGGVLRYRVEAAGRGEAEVRAVSLPEGLVVAPYWSGASARTTDLRARVDALRGRDPSAYARCFAALSEAAHAASTALESTSASRFLSAARATQAALAALGAKADAPIVPAAFQELAAIAEAEGAVFLPSGAGGGDCGVWLGNASPSPRFDGRTRALGMLPLPIGIDREGVRACDQAE